MTVIKVDDDWGEPLPPPVLVPDRWVVHMKAPMGVNRYLQRPSTHSGPGPLWSEDRNDHRVWFVDHGLAKLRLSETIESHKKQYRPGHPILDSIFVIEPVYFAKPL